MYALSHKIFATQVFVDGTFPWLPWLLDDNEFENNKFLRPWFQFEDQKFKVTTINYIVFEYLNL